jgi:hypothetical protein
MASQNLDFSLPGNVGDTGEIDTSAIRPFEDNEDAYAANFNRPLQNLRNRTEVLRKASEDLAYLADADRAFILRGGGLVNWAGPTTDDSTLGTFTIAEQLVLRSFLSPDVSTPASTLLYGVKINTRTTVSGSIKPPRAYSGANKIRVIVTGVSGASLGLLIDGTPADNVRLTVNSAASGGTTRQELVDYLNGNSTFLNAGLVASLYDGALGSDNIGVNFTVSPTTYNLKGAVDAEKHVISPTGLASFFTLPGNLMREGDTLCIWYDTLTDNTYGGRRQSIAESPENSASVDNNLFLLRKNPERQPLAIPLCTVANGFLIFVNGVGLEAGLGAPVYSGSEGHPYARFEIVSNRGQIRLGKDGETSRVTTKDDFDVMFGGGNADAYHTHATSAVADAAMAAITAHLSDNDDAHDASAISVGAIAGITGDDVQEVLQSIVTNAANHVHPLATTSSNGFMSAADKIKLNDALHKFASGSGVLHGQSITFPVGLFTAVPRVRIFGGIIHEPRSKWNSSGDGTGTGAWDSARATVEDIAALSLTTSGFTVRARLRQPGTGVGAVNMNPDSPTAVIDALNEVHAVSLLTSSTRGDADQYTLRYQIAMTASAKGSGFHNASGTFGNSSAQIHLKIAIEWSLDGSTGWTLIKENNHFLNAFADVADDNHLVTTNKTDTITEIVTVPSLMPTTSKFRVRLSQDTTTVFVPFAPDWSMISAGATASYSYSARLNDTTRGDATAALSYTTSGVEQYASKTIDGATVSWEAFQY